MQNSLLLPHYKKNNCKAGGVSNHDAGIRGYILLLVHKGVTD